MVLYFAALDADSSSQPRFLSEELGGIHTVPYDMFKQFDNARQKLDQYENQCISDLNVNVAKALKTDPTVKVLSEPTALFNKVI